MVDWKIYKRMTPEDRDIWKFRFERDRPRFNPMWIFLIYFGMIQLSMTILIILKEYINFATDIHNLFTLAFRWGGLCIIIYFVDFLIDVFGFVYCSYQEHKWLKERGYK